MEEMSIKSNHSEHSVRTLTSEKRKRTRDYVVEQSSMRSELSNHEQASSERTPNPFDKYKHETFTFMSDKYRQPSYRDLSVQEQDPVMRENANPQTNERYEKRNTDRYARDYEPPIAPKFHSTYAGRDYESPIENHGNGGNAPPNDHSVMQREPDCDNHSPWVGTELTKFLVKKELLLSRLSAFNDRPENYLIWKGSFSIIMKDLSVTPMEELDLLIKYLGADSKQHAMRLRASHPTDPLKGLTRIWERLDERYGSPELIEAILKEKIAKFPKISTKDAKRMYELSDIASEVESVKENPKYKTLLAYYDSSFGVNSFVSKLPGFLQSKWTDRALKHKVEHDVLYPPFAVFTKFLKEMSIRMNDPSFAFDKGTSPSFENRDKFTPVRGNITTIKTKLTPKKPSKCPLHETDKHPLSDCRTFNSKPIAEKKSLIRQYGLCFKCCNGKHSARDCQEHVSCNVCNSNRHCTAMHEERSTSQVHSGEELRRTTNDATNPSVRASCTQVCGREGFKGKSCAKTVLVNIYPEQHPERSLKAYVLIDDQSNRSLARSEFFDYFNENAHEIEYVLSSCSGYISTTGRQTSGYIIESLDGSTRLSLPTLIECNQIPNMREEIPTPEVAKYHEHLRDIADEIPPYDQDAPILLLIGRDMIAAHHVLDQRIGHNYAPYAQKLRFGWVVIGETCLGAAHRPETITTNKVHVLSNGRPSILQPCPNDFRLRTHTRPTSDFEFGENVFIQTSSDDKIGFSIEDKEFLSVMNSGFRKSESGNWSAPLPFKSKRQVLPDNYEQALQRARKLRTNLRMNPDKEKQFCAFMEKIFQNGHAEPAPPLKTNEEKWYLPIFGVFHPKKSKIRVVFDSSAKCQGVSLNDVLMTGPDLTNSLIGVLLKFRKEKVAVTADIEQMFFNFYVHEEDRNFLRFLWFRDNDINNELVEFRMCVHVFGNSPSPAVATFGLRKSACDHHSTELCNQVCELVNKHFYVDDALVSLPDAESAIEIMKKTQDVLKQNGNIRLHKIRSNSSEVLKSFPTEDLSEDVLSMDFSDPVRSLGLLWDIKQDAFTYQLFDDVKPFTRRGILSTVNSIYDPLGFIAPVILGGRLVLKKAMSSTVDWDEPLPDNLHTEWEKWRMSLSHLESLKIPRMYANIQHACQRELHTFCDASKEAIGVATYVKLYDKHGESDHGFVMGKSKLAPHHSHTIPRLELCAAVLGVEIAEFVAEHLNIPKDACYFYTDSRVVLGYIFNESRRFHVYVANRVDRIRRATSPSQWNFVATENNPADQATRYQEAHKIENSMWLKGPPLLQFKDQESFNLINPDEDKELKLSSFKTEVKEMEGIGSERFTRFSSWHSLVKALANINRLAARFSKRSSLKDPLTLYKEAEQFILKTIQQEFYSKELNCLYSNQPLPKNSSILPLSPILDEEGLLRVGGRLRRANLPTGEKTPILILGKHYIATLLFRHFHESIYHQGRRLTEGAICRAGYWITCGKRLICSMLHSCVPCRKLRGKTEYQKMSDLPTERLTPSPPFSYVGVDVFGPWTIVTRKTRGGSANSKRWAVMFSCLVTRGVHIEVIEELSSSSFINALRRFVSLRGPVVEFRSDRGTNFVGATDDLKIDVINVEDGPAHSFLFNSGTVWKFNAPHSSHMAGAWERMIGIARRILDSMLSHVPCLTHEVLCTLMAEICAIMNSRPLAAVSTDPDSPTVLSPATILTQKTGQRVEPFQHFGVKDMIKSQWRQVQVLADQFWTQWRERYLTTLQARQKWNSERPSLKEGDVILMKDAETPRIQWPLGIVQQCFESEDGRIRKVSLRVIKHEKPVLYTRPVSELIYLFSV
ncbi:uncharacterized protein LOC134256031 [Saccostrea cucullata]|uniref:uncharacterized protein LOC134256031 n=1 Tax=Saccostrea cuccullata TaxID=36930 RepID=UPI002ED55E9B